MQEDDDFQTPCPVSASIRRLTNAKTKTVRKCKNTTLSQSDSDLASSQSAKRSRSSQATKENVSPLEFRDKLSRAFHQTGSSYQPFCLPVDPSPPRVGFTLLSQSKEEQSLGYEVSIEAERPSLPPDRSLPLENGYGDESHRIVGRQTLNMPTDFAPHHSNSIEFRLLASIKQQQAGGYETANEAERPSSPSADGSESPQCGNGNLLLGCGDELNLSFHQADGCPPPDGGSDPNPSNSFSIESRSLSLNSEGDVVDGVEVDMEANSELDILLGLCTDASENGDPSSSLTVTEPVECPVCGTDISELKDESRQLHTNACLDRCESPKKVSSDHRMIHISPPKTDAVSLVDSTCRVAEWLHSLGLDKYKDAFNREEIDWDTLQCMSEEDLISIGVTALGPRRKIMLALNELKKGRAESVLAEAETDNSTVILEKADTKKQAASRLITDYFLGPTVVKKKSAECSTEQKVLGKGQLHPDKRQVSNKKRAPSGRYKDVPLWCNIPGTPFRVDAFRYLRRDCTHWFLSHFHADHYQGLTRSFSHGKIYCSMITAKLVHMKCGIPWDKLEVLPLNQRVDIDGVHVTFFDANHCPGAVIMLFEPPNGKAVLHTGDFRFCEQMENITALAAHPVHTLILDTTYCDPQYDFPKQEVITQFVVDAIQAESFHPKTLFLIGSYTIGKERVFLEVARVLRKKVYVTAAKMRILKCLELPKEDMQWLTTNESESHVHVVPLWSLASFKRLKQLANQYTNRYSLIVAISPTGWSFGKGKKSTGRKWQQGTIIRYEVPYSEHSSFTELKRFVQFISPVDIIPSVNNHGEASSRAMLSKLLS